MPETRPYEVFHAHERVGVHAPGSWHELPENGDLVVHEPDGTTTRYARGAWHAAGHGVRCGFIGVSDPSCPWCAAGDARCPTCGHAEHPAAGCQLCSRSHPKGSCSDH